MTCRLYAASPEGGLFPVIDQPLPLHVHGDCPTFDDQGRLIAHYADETRVFILRETTEFDPKSAVLEGELPGAFFAKKREAVVVKMRQNGKTLYRVFNNQGELINGKWFEEVHNVCRSIIFLKHEEVWYALEDDGSFTEEAELLRSFLRSIYYSC
jgi:hypothetical protein